MPSRSNSPLPPPPEWPDDPKQLVDLKFTKAALGVRTLDSVRKFQELGILEEEVKWGLRGLRWRVEQVRAAVEKQREGKAAEEAAKPKPKT